MAAKQDQNDPAISVDELLSRISIEKQAFTSSLSIECENDGNVNKLDHILSQLNMLH